MFLVVNKRKIGSIGIQTQIESLVREHLPSGSGFDRGTKLDLDRSHGDKLIFTTAYHHMHESGMYAGWTEHEVIITPSLAHQFNMRITGRNRNDIKELIREEFHSALSMDLQPEYDWHTCQTKHGVALDSVWLDGCTQRWFVLHNGVSISPQLPDYLTARAWAVQHFAEVR